MDSHLIIGAFDAIQAGESFGLLDFLKDLLSPVHKHLSRRSFLKQIVPYEHRILLALVRVFIQHDSSLFPPLVNLVHHLLIHKVRLLELYLVWYIGRVQVVKHLHLYGAQGLPPGLKTLLHQFLHFCLFLFKLIKLVLMRSLVTQLLQRTSHGLEHFYKHLHLKTDLLDDFFLHSDIMALMLTE